MALFRSPLSRTVQAGGAVATILLSVFVWLLLSAKLRFPLALEVASFTLFCLIVLWAILWWLERSIIMPLGAVSDITLRVAQGDLRISKEDLARVGGGQVTDSLNRMIRELNSLVGAIRHAATDSAALAEEISSAT